MCFRSDSWLSHTHPKRLGRVNLTCPPSGRVAAADQMSETGVHVLNAMHLFPQIRKTHCFTWRQRASTVTTLMPVNRGWPWRLQEWVTFPGFTKCLWSFLKKVSNGLVLINVNQLICWHRTIISCMFISVVFFLLLWMMGIVMSWTAHRAKPPDKEQQSGSKSLSLNPSLFSNNTQFCSLGGL